MERKNVLSDGFSNVEARFPEEKLFMDGAGHLPKKKLHLLFDSENDTKSRLEGGGIMEPKSSVCDSGKDEVFLEDGEGNEIDKDKLSVNAVSNENYFLSDTSESYSEDGLHRNLNYPIEIACREGFGNGNLEAKDRNNNIQKMKENVQELDSQNFGNIYLDDHQTLPLWVKWRGKWQAGFRCPAIDCPSSTLRSKPTHERKKYILIFFPRTKTYSWADMLLVCAIDEFPEPLVYGTHRRWRKFVKDMSTPRRYIMQKLAVAMLNMSDQLHIEAVIEAARRTTIWKEFAMEASRCRDYPSLGQMLLKLQRMILPCYVCKEWLENSYDSWSQRCHSAPSTESIETLTEELVESVLWHKVDELWNAPVQPILDPEWKTWKQEAMKWFFVSHSRPGVPIVKHNNPNLSLNGELQTSRKRVKLEIRRPETSASLIEVSDFQKLPHIENFNTKYRHNFAEGFFKMSSKNEPQKTLPKITEALDSGIEVAHEGRVEPGSIVGTSGIGCKDLTPNIPDHSNSSSRYRQCLAFIEAKGRQCGRWANDDDIYCCVHLTFHSARVHPQVDQTLPSEAPMCQGTTTRGNRCKHRARYNLTFCKKHWFPGNHNSTNADTPLLLTTEASQRIQQEDRIPENISSSNVSTGQGMILLREDRRSAEKNLIPIMKEESLDERNLLMKQSELCNTLPNGISFDVQHCIGNFSHSNSGQCQEFPRRHTLYCEKHLPRFLKRARNGKSRLISKDVFINLLRSCSGKQKLYLHQACELLYGFLKSGLSCQKFLSKRDNLAWILAESAKDVNVGEYLLKLVSCEREKITELWGFNCDLDNQVSSKEINFLSTMNVDSSYTTLKCKICAQEFPDDHMLVSHWTEVHKKEARWLFKGYACAVCMNLFTNRKVLETHVIEKHGVQFLEHSILIRCVSCSSHFANPEKLWQHVFSFHLSELKLPSLNSSNSSLLDDSTPQKKVGITIKLCQTRSVPEKDESQKYTCRFCGLKFELLPDLGRHHQFAHMIPYSGNHFSSKRRSYYFNRSKPIHSRYWKKMGSTFKFKHKNTRVMLEKIQSSSSASQMKTVLYQQPSEAFSFRGLSDSKCCNVAETLISKIQRTKRRPTALEILSFARSACCRINLDSSLAVEYGVLPQNIYLKAAKLCSELNIQVSWHQEGFICPSGCKPITKSCSSVPLKPLKSLSVDPPEIESMSDVKWEVDECHYILSAEHFNWKQRRHTLVLCEDMSFGKENIPVACVIDEDLKHLITDDIQEPSLSMPWMVYTYATERLMDASLCLDTKSSQLGCACPELICCPEKCDHVYLFDNDYENAVDIHGKLMQGRFPYDDNRRILLKEGYLVYECNSLCKCDMSCKNRVLQRGLQVKLQVFRTETKGWAVRAGEFIPRGTFVCEYIGVINTSEEAQKTGQREYFYDMDAHFNGSRGMIEGALPYAIDASKYGNVSRFINHSCSPNLVNYLVLVESMDYQLAHVGFFAKCDIGIGEELSFDYCPKLLPGEEGQRCHCGTPNCRTRLY